MSSITISRLQSLFSLECCSSVRGFYFDKKSAVLRMTKNVTFHFGSLRRKCNLFIMKLICAAKLNC